jgi:GH15 family glucan-1,4-alpha-glucosidase
MDRKMEERLVEDTLVRRYEVEQTHVDGLPDGEASFTACSFWFVERLARGGQFEKAPLCLKSFCAAPITSDCIQRSLAQTDNILAIPLKHSRIRL